MDVSRMITIFGNYGFADAATQDLVDQINDVYHDINDLEPWPYLEKELDLTFNGTTGLPTNWPTDYDAAITLNDTITGKRLIPTRIEEIREIQGTNLTYQSNPLYYYFIANQLYVWPVPSSSVAINQLKLVYMQDEPDLTSGSLSANIVLPARYHWAIVYGVLSALYLQEDDQTQSDYFLNRMDRKVQRMRRNIWQRNFDVPDTIQVLDDDTSDYYGFEG